MRSPFLSFLIFLLTAALAAQPSPARQRRKGENTEARVDAYLKPYLDMGSFSGAVLIAKGGKILLSKGYGMANYELDVPNTPRTRFHIASVSKSFTAAAVLLLQERGLLVVSDSLVKFIPDYPDGDKINIHHLLTHTSGIPNVNSFPDYDAKSKFPHTVGDLVQLFKSKSLIQQPGQKYSYSNSNYNLLAYIIEKVSGRRFGAFLDANIFQPLGMSDTGHDGHAGALLKNRATGYVPAGVNGLENAPYIDWSIKTGNGSLYSTAEDLYKWDRALYTEKLLKRGTLEKLFSEHVSGVGYGWFVGKRNNRKVVRMNGRSPGFGSEIQRYVNDDVCIIVLSNNYAATPSVIINDLAAIAFGEKYEVATVARPVRLSPAMLDGCVGRYQFGPDFFVPGAIYTVENQNDHLLLKSGDWTTALVPQSEAKFFSREFWSTVTFVRDDNRAATELIWEYGKERYAARRQNGP